MRKTGESGLTHCETGAGSEVAAPAYGELPNRLMATFEVAAFVGCHEETVRRAYLRGLLNSQRFGVRGRRFHASDVLDWIRRGAPRRVSETKEKEDGCSKICKPKGCRGSPRCEHPWWFDVMHAGKRWRMPADDFAIPRGAAEPVTSKQTAERVWEPKFIAELMAGKDPGVSLTPPKQEGVLTVATFLDQYFTNYVEAEGLKSADTVAGHIKALKTALGELPVVALEKPADISRFKAAYRHGHAVATLNRALGVLRAAINWGRSQDPPLLSTTPFHRFGVNMKFATKRSAIAGFTATRKSLLAACLTMNTWDHK